MVRDLPSDACSPPSLRSYPTMDAHSRQQEPQGNSLSLLNVAIEAVNLAKELSSATPAKAVFGTVSALLTMIRVRFLPSPTTYSDFTCKQDSMVNKAEYVELGLACADVCRALDRGLNGKKLDGLSQSVFEAIMQLTTWVLSVTYTVWTGCSR